MPATTFLGLILEGILITIFLFFQLVFQVSLLMAFGPHFLDFGLISASILKAFSLLFEDAGNLEE